jgi:hypothetical protein
MTTRANKWAHAAVAVVVFAMVLTCLQRQPIAAQDAPNENQGEGVAEVVTRFADTLALPTRTGATVPLRVTLKEWHLAGHERDISLPEQGFYVAHLRWGSISTRIGDKFEVRHPGDFWTVEQGGRMVVRIKRPGEEALLQTLAVSPAR